MTTTRKLDAYASRGLTGYRHAARTIAAGGNLRSLPCRDLDAATAGANEFSLPWPPTLDAIDGWLADHDVDLDAPAGTDDDARRNARDFWSYFNVADELDGDLTLDDLDDTYVAEARRAADLYDLAWPPVLADAEDFALAHSSRWRAWLSGGRGDPVRRPVAQLDGSQPHWPSRQ